MLEARLRVLALILTDALTMSIAWVSSVVLSAKLTPPRLFPASTFAETMGYALSRWGFLLFFLVFNTAARLYHGNLAYPGLAFSPVEEFRRLTLTTLATGLLFFSYLAFYGKQSLVSTGTVVLAVALTILCAQPARNLLRRFLRRFNLLQISVVLLGSKGDREELKQTIGASSYCGIRVAAEAERTHEAIDQAWQRNIKYCISLQPLRVFRQSIQALLDNFLVVVSIPETKVFPIALTQPVELGGFGGFEMTNQLHQRGTRAIKRLSESVATIVAGAICIVPGLCIAGLLCLVYGPKNVFYRTQRLGKKGRPFTIWKFQTMVPNAKEQLAAILSANPELADEWKRTGKLKNDPRITRIGKWLRHTSFDEIPQLLNVLRGEMALIGPRPIVQREVARYGRYYEIVSGVKPGITGFWQVSGRSELDYNRRIALDLYYVQNWSLWLDAWIFIRTFFVVLFQHGSY